MTTLMIEITMPDNQFNNIVYHFLTDWLYDCLEILGIDGLMQVHFKSFLELTEDKK